MMLKFNIGDRVKILKETAYRDMDSYIGGTYEIERMSEVGNYILKGVMRPNGSTAVWYEDELEEVQEKMHKFNVGDRVKILSVHDLMSDKYIGTTGVVQEDNDTPYVLMDIDGEIWSLKEERLELASAIPQIKTGHLVMTSFDNQWRLAQVDIGHTAHSERTQLLNFDNFGYIDPKEHKILKIAEVKYVGDIFRAIQNGTSVEQVKGFKVIYDRTKDEAKDKLQKTISTLQAQLDAAQDELKEMA